MWKNIDSYLDINIISIICLKYFTIQFLSVLLLLQLIFLL